MRASTHRYHREAASHGCALDLPVVDVLKLEYVVPEDMPDSSFQPVAWGDWPREVLRYRVGVGLQERAHGLDCLLLRYRWVEALDVEAGQEGPW